MSLTTRDPATAQRGHGAHEPMVDARDRIAGRTRYVIDVDVPGAAHAALVRSPIPRGRIGRVDTEEASSLPGVVAVLTAEDLERHALAGVRFGTIDQDQPILADEVVRHVGEPVAAVVAETRAQARRAASAVRVEIEPEPPVLTIADASARDAPLVHPGVGGNVLARVAYANGDLAAARSAARHRFTHRFSSPAAQQVTMEPQVTLARWDDDRLEMWATTQNPSRVAQELARIFSLELDAVRLHVPPLGGGYGGKNHAKNEPLVAFLALACSRPVRLENSRAEEFVATTKHAAEVEIETGVDDQGLILYRRVDVGYSGGAYASSSRAVAKAGALAACGPYRCPVADVTSTVYYTNLPPAGSFRGLGVNQVAWAAERQLDIVARALTIDPVDIRRRNAIRPGGRLSTGEAVPGAHWLECLEAAWRGLEGTTRPEATTSRGGDGPLRRGRGIALAIKHTVSPGRSEATVALTPDGRFEVRTSSVDMGQGSPTVLARMAARVLDVPIDLVVPIHPDTAVTPFDSTTSASRTTASMGEAVRRAATALRQDVVERIAAEQGCDAVTVSLVGGVVASPRGEEPVADVGARFGEVTATAEFVNDPEIDAETGKPVSSTHWHQGAVAVEVTVDVETGRVTIERASGASWAGEVLSAAGARLQDEGNIVFGIGPALFEEIVWRHGSPANATLVDYRIPSIRDVPMDLSTIQLEEAGAELQGLGESLIPAVAPAIGNAVAAAVGAELTAMPMTPQRLLAALDEERSR